MQTKKKLHVLWLAPIKHPLSLHGHPAPWIEELAKALSPYINLTILSVSHYNKKYVEVYKLDQIVKIFLRGSRPKLEVISLKILRILRLRKWLKLNSTKFDLIHIHGTENQFEIAASAVTTPKVLSIQGIISEILNIYNPPFFQNIGWRTAAFYELKSYSQINNYVCRTNWDKSIVKKHNPDARVFEIWEPIRSDFFINEKIEKGENILFLGGTNGLKGIEIALLVFQQSREFLKGKFLLGGHVNLFQLDHIIKRNGLTLHIDQDILILGFLEPKDILLHAKTSLCLLHPTLIDNSPNSVCEAQVMGLPVIASNVGGVGTLIEPFVTGLLCDLRVDDFVSKMEKLYTNEVLWSNISCNSRISSRERHEISKIVDNTIAMYTTLVEGVYEHRP